MVSDARSEEDPQKPSRPLGLRNSDPEARTHFVLVPRRELRKRIPRVCGKKWSLYLWVYDDGSCYQVRDLDTEKKLDTVNRGVQDRHRDFSEWLERWNLLDENTKEGPR